MKNKVKTNETTFESYLIRATSENFDKMKKDRYSYDENETWNKVKNFFGFGKNKDEKNEPRKDGDLKAVFSKRKEQAQETQNMLAPVIEAIKTRVFDSYDQIKSDFDAYYKEDKSYAMAAIKLIGKYIKKMFDGFSGFISKIWKKITFQESKKNKYKKDINIFTEAAKTTKYVKIGGKWVSGIFTYVFSGTEYVVNTLMTPMTFTVRNFMATPNLPTIEDAWKTILGKDYNALKGKIKTLTPNEQSIEFDQRLFNTKIRPFIVGEGDTVATRTEQKDQEREDKLKLNVAETKRGVQNIDRRTQRMETSVQNIDQRTLQTFVNQNRILIGVIIIIVLLAVIIGLMIYGYSNIKDTLANMESDNAFRYMDNKLDVLSVKKEVQDGFGDMAQRIQIKDSADIARYSSLMNNITQSTDDAANKVIKEVSKEVQTAKADIINKIGKSSTTLQQIINKNGLSINQTKVLIKNLGGDLKKMGEDLKEQGFKNTQALQRDIDDNANEILNQMKENDSSNKALLNSIDYTTTETAKGLFADGKEKLIGLVDRFTSDAQERLTREKLAAFQKAAGEVDARVNIK